MANNNTFLHKAKNQKQDEFYTLLPTIVEGLKSYTSHFKDKIIYCNCDNPFHSNFFKYFVMNFNSLGLKKLIATCYSPSSKKKREFQFTNNTNQNQPLNYNDKPYKAEVTFVPENVKCENIGDVKGLLELKGNSLQVLKGDGDFRSDECIEILKECDIVVTNPPFSLTIEFVPLIIGQGKDIIILGHLNILKYKTILPLIITKKLYIGNHENCAEFQVPSYYEKKDKRYREDSQGNKFRSLGNICWWSSFPKSKYPDFIPLVKSYSEDLYPKYDTFDAINVDKVKDIPYDYDGLMGVPITFITKYNPNQFDMIGILSGGGREYDFGSSFVNGKELFVRILIKRKT